MTDTSTVPTTAIPGEPPSEAAPLAAAGWPTQRQDGFDDNRGGWMLGNDTGPLAAVNTTLEGGKYNSYTTARAP